MNEVTRIINAIQDGDKHASEELLPLVYEELRFLAAQKMNQERPGQTLQATALVHEAYIRLLGEDNHVWDGRGHFFAAAAEAMRRILVETARRKKGLRRGGEHSRADVEISILTDEVESRVSNDQLFALDEALMRLEKEDKIGAEIVKLRYFTGLTIQQTAKVMKISERSVKRYWAYARAWLLEEIG